MLRRKKKEGEVTHDKFNTNNVYEKATVYANTRML